jgi:hypothetical protein
MVPEPLKPPKLPRSMNAYRIYGLNLTTNIALPGPIELGVQQSDIADVEISLGYFPDWLTRSPQSAGIAPNWYPGSLTPSVESDADTPLRVWSIVGGSAAAQTGDFPSLPSATTADRDCYFYCLYDDGTAFLVGRSGDRIWATWPEDLTLEDTATYLLGPILGFVLRLRQTVCLHANAIAIADRVVVLVGTAGAGKSTTAAAFAQQGYPILSDDVVPIVDRGDTFLIQPAYPRIRLWDESVRALYGTNNALPRLVPTHPTWDKRYLDLSQPGYKFQTEPLPLAAIYYLNARSDDPRCPYIEPMVTQECLITLITNTYTNYLLDKRLRAHEFELLSRLIKHIPVCQLNPHTQIDRLPDLLTTVLADLQTHGCRSIG